MCLKIEMLYSLYVLAIVFIDASSVLAAKPRNTREETVHVISLGPDFTLRDMKYIDIHQNVIRRRAQIEQTTGLLLDWLSRKRTPSEGSRILPPGGISYASVDSPDWTYESYLALSIKYILDREMEFFDGCHFKNYAELPPCACFMPLIRRPRRDDEDIGDNPTQNLLSQIIPSLISKNSTTGVLIIKSIAYFNCRKDSEASSLISTLVETEPREPFVRFLYSEILSRQKGNLRVLSDALNQVDIAIRLNDTDLRYREKRLSLLLRLGELQEARSEATYIRTKAKKYLKDKYCAHCLKTKVKNPVSPTAWRPWFMLGLWSLLTRNGTQAEEDLSVALDLALAASYKGGFEISDSVSSIIRHLKAIAQHDVNKFQDAMELAVTNAHANPSAMDAVLLISQTLARASLYDRALNMLNLALPLLDAYSTGPCSEGNSSSDCTGSESTTSVIEILTEPKLIKRVALQLRSWVQYRLGNLLEAEEDAKACLDLLWSDALCSYVKSMCMIVRGRLVDAIRAAAPVLSRWIEPRVKKSPEYLSLDYLKEWSRFLHSHLNSPVNEFRWFSNLSSVFKGGWIQWTPMNSLDGYFELPGISSELPGLLTSPKRFSAILSEKFQWSDQPQKENDTFNATAVCSTTNYRSWTSAPWRCQSRRVRHLAQFLCRFGVKFEVIMGPSFLAPGPTMPPLNRLHRLALGLGTLRSAELIRSFWCQRRRVSFGTCWSYSPADSGEQNLWRASLFSPTDEDELDWERWDRCTAPDPAASFPDSRRHACLPFIPGAPDWFAQVSFASALLLLADPSESPPFWFSDTWDDSGRWTDDSEPDQDSHSDEQQHSEKEKKTDFSRKLREVEPENDWATGAIREQRYFIQHGHLLIETVAYAPVVVEMMFSAMRLNAKIKGPRGPNQHREYRIVIRRGKQRTALLFKPQHSGCSDRPPEVVEDLLDQFHDMADSSNHFREKVGRTLNITSQDRLLSNLDHLWHEAQQYGLVDDDNRIHLNIYAPGRVDLKHAGSSDDSAKRYLAAVLLFEKDSDQNYMLSTLILSNKRHRADLIAEMDAAYSQFLIQGEKALAAILAGSGPHKETRRLTSPLDDQYLQSAMNSAFHWLYYWSILKPLSSSYSFHVGFSMTLAMLRALGVEPRSTQLEIEQNLELESLFTGSPESFAFMCQKVLNPNWLSRSSVALTWQAVPDELVHNPKDFLELLNLQSVSQCIRA
ncbi:unnamed protein product [Calicophoron daubneyi]|uniref:Uncharacterized protein n=1 Tax=Calicophoron daubneyi TaxID=300641 RepID=A0AAV2TLJ6_CALDB